MSWEGIVAIATCLGLIITIATFVFALGKLVSRFEILEGRVVEDREKNSTQHAEFYVTSKNVEGLKIELVYVRKSLDEMKLDVREILDRIPKGE